MDIICSSKLTDFLELRSRKALRVSKQITLVAKNFGRFSFRRKKKKVFENKTVRNIYGKTMLVSRNKPDVIRKDFEITEIVEAASKGTRIRGYFPRSCRRLLSHFELQALTVFFMEPLLVSRG